MAKPRKAKELIPKTAADCKVSEELASDVVDFFYSELSVKLESMEDPIIKVPILGSMRLHGFKLGKSVERLERNLNDKDAENFKSMKRRQRFKDRLAQQIEALKKLKDIEDERDRRKKDLGKS